MASRKALQLIKQAKAGNVAAQLELGCIYLGGGEGLAANVEAASAWLGRAVAAGSREAAIVVGTRLAPESLADPWGAMDCYLHAAADGAPQAALWAAQLLLERAGEGERRRAMELLGSAAGAGLVAAQELLGALLVARTDGDAEAHAEGCAWLSRAAACGSERAMRLLVDTAWERRDGGAIPWLERFARSGDAESAYRLGVLLRDRTADQERLRRACHWTAVAARAAHPLALFDLGRMAAGSLEGMARRNYKLAARCLRQALDHGVADAAVELALLHSHKRFLGRTPERVEPILEEGARLGSAEAQYRLALALLKRKGDAETLYRAACRLLEATHGGHHLAAAKLERIAPPAPPMPAHLRDYRNEVIAALLPRNAAIAWRLRAMAGFGLRLHEMLLLDPERCDRGFCLVLGPEADVSRKQERLVRVATREERQLLDQLKAVLASPENARSDFTGSYKQRYQKLAWLGRRHGIDWNRFAGARPPGREEVLRRSIA